MNSAAPSPPARGSRTALLLMGTLGSLGALGLLGLLGIILLRIFVVEPYSVPAMSMAPSLPPGQYFLADKRVGQPARGDVVVFEYPPDPSVDYVKRIIGLPGEEIELRDAVVFIDGRPLERSLVAEVSWADSSCHTTRAQQLEERDGDRSWPILHDLEGNWPWSDFGPFAIPEGQYFVLGDNRDNSSDSRAWGTVPAESIKGKLGWTLFRVDPCGGS
jgi:signal peptidase I